MVQNPFATKGLDHSGVDTREQESYDLRTPPAGPGTRKKMASFGERLKREREMRNVSLEEIAESTKIGKRNLLALETEEFNKLPGGIFNKGFVRAYAKYLGLDEDQAVTDFLAAENAASTGIRLPPEPGPAPHSGGDSGGGGKKSRKERSKEL